MSGGHVVGGRRGAIIRLLPGFSPTTTISSIRLEVLDDAAIRGSRATSCVTLNATYADVSVICFLAGQPAVNIFKIRVKVYRRL